MSRISLTAYHLFNPARPPKEITISNVTVPGAVGRRLPPGSLTALYGFRERLTELATVQRGAIAKGRDICLIDFDVEVGESSRLRIGATEAAEATFVNLALLQAAFAERVGARLAALAADRGYRAETPWYHGMFLTSYPDLLGPIRDEFFPSADVFAYRIRVAGHFLQVGTLWNRRNVTDVRVSGLDDVIVRFASDIPSGQSA